MDLALVLLAWLIIALTAGSAFGHFIHAGMGEG